MTASVCSRVQLEFYSSLSFCTYVYSSVIGRVFCRIFGARGCPRLSVFLFGPRSVGNPSCCVVSGSVARLCLWSARVQHACLSSLVHMSLLWEFFFGSSSHHWWKDMAGLWVCCSLSFCGNATRMRSLAVHGQCRYHSDVEHFTTDSFPDDAFVSILI